MEIATDMSQLFFLSDHSLFDTLSWQAGEFFRKLVALEEGGDIMGCPNMSDLKLDEAKENKMK